MALSSTCPLRNGGTEPSQQSIHTEIGLLAWVCDCTTLAQPSKPYRCPPLRLYNISAWRSGSSGTCTTHGKRRGSNASEDVSTNTNQARSCSSQRKRRATTPIESATSQPQNQSEAPLPVRMPVATTAAASVQTPRVRMPRGPASHQTAAKRSRLTPLVPRVL